MRNLFYQVFFPTPVPATPKPPHFDMRGPRILPPAKSFAVNAPYLFSWYFSQPEDSIFLASPNPPTVLVLGNNWHYSDVFQQLHSLFPPNCASFEGDEVKDIGDTPTDAGGYADIWEATLYGRRVIRKSYRRYDAGDVECIFRVGNDDSSRGPWFTFCSRDITGK